MSLADLFISVKPDMRTFDTDLSRGLRDSKVPAEAGRAQGVSYAARFKESARGLGTTIGKQFAAEATPAIDTATARVGAALKRQADAVGRLRVAELRLQDTRAKGSTSAAVIAAEKELAAVRAREGVSAEAVAAAERELAAVRAKAGPSAAALVAAEERVAAAQRGTEASAAGVAGATKTLARAQATSATQADVASKRMVESTGKMSLLGGAAGKARSAVSGLGGAMLGMVGITAAFELGKFAKEALASAGDFQKSMNLLVTAGGESTHVIGTISDGIKSLAVSTGTSTKDLAEGMYTVEKASFRGADGLKVLKAAAQAAADEQVNLGVLTNGLTSIMRSYDIPASGVVKVTNELVAASGRAKASMAQFSGSLSTVLPIAASAHLSFEQVAGAVATLTSHGTSADEATQHLAFTIRGLLNPNLQAQKMMANFGLSATDLSKNLGKRGLSGTLDLISEAILKKMGPNGLVLIDTFNKSKDAAKDAATMFGQLSPKAQALAKEFMQGGVSAGGFSKSVSEELKGMDSTLASSWLTAYKRANGFNDVLKQGGAQSKTYEAALAKITGGSVGLTTALQLTGSSASYLHESIKEIGDAGKKTGDNIAVWDQTQKTFNIQLSRFKEGIQVAGINLGTKLLPPLTNLLKHLVDLPGWLHKNSTALGGLTLAVGFAAAALAALRIAEMIATGSSFTKWLKGATSETKLFTAAQAALSLVMDANPIALVVIGIAALVAGFIYAYKHSQTFRTIVHEALHAVGDAGVWLWNKALKPAFDALKVAFFAVGDAAVWLWKNGIKPAFDGIVTGGNAVVGAGKTVWSALSTAFRAVGDAASWLWNKAIRPAFDGLMTGVHAVGDVVSWLYDKVIHPVFTAIGVVVKIAWNIAKAIFILWDAGWRLVGLAMLTVYEKLIKPALHGVASLVGWLWNKVAKPTFALFSLAWHELGAVVGWVHSHLITPALHGVASLIGWLWNKGVKPTIRLMSDGWNLFGSGVEWVRSHVLAPAMRGVASLIGWLWDKVGKPTFRLMGDGFGALGSGVKTVYDKVIHPVLKAFGDLGTWLWTKAIKPALGFIGDAFTALKKHIGDPINFVIKTIYDNGIRPFFNAIAAATGQSTRLDYIAPLKLATGGPARGPGTGTSDQIPAMLSNGEHVWTAKEVRNAGGHDVMERMRADYRFAGGGPVIFQPTTSGRQNPSYPGHSGIDFFGRVGDPILATTNERINYVGAGRGYGNAVFATAANGLQMVYGHMSRILAHIGQVAQGGQRIGEVGYSGNVRPPGPGGAHLHFEVAPGGRFDLASNRNATAAYLRGADVHHYGGGGGPLQQLLGKAVDYLSGPLGVVKKLVAGMVSRIPGGGVGVIGQAAKRLPGMALRWAEDFFSPFKGGPATASGPLPSGGSVNRWAPTIRQAMGMTSMPSGTFDNWMRQVQTESGGNPRAVQTVRDINSGVNAARGLLQVIPPTFAAYRSHALPNDEFNPLANAYAGMNYAKNAYGLARIESVIGHGHGYSRGGRVESMDAGGDLGYGFHAIYHGKSKPDSVVTDAFRNDVTSKLDRISAQTGATVHYDNATIQVVSVDEFFAKQERTVRDLNSVSQIATIGRG